jgi:hypothetical protein
MFDIRNRSRLCLAGLAGLMVLAPILAACTSAIPTPTPVPSPQPLRVYLSPLLEPLRPLLAGCAPSGSAVYYTADETGADAVLLMGQPEEAQGSLWQLGTESMVPAVHPSRNLASLDLSVILQIYQGQVSDWSQLGQPAAPLHAWVYASQTQIGHILAALASPTQGAAFQSAPGPLEMRQSLAKDPNALGWLPARWLDASVRQVSLAAPAPANLSQPILARTEGQPQGLTQDLLVCLQNKLKEP